MSSQATIVISEKQRLTELSVINIFIPVYNGERFLSQTLDSILGQSYTYWQLYCVDDSSADNSYNILQEYASKDTRINIYHKKNEGDAPHSWHFIIPHLAGEFTLYMSQDDLLKHDTLEKLINRQKETDADCVIPALTWYYGDDRPSKTDRGINGDLSPILSGIEAFELMMDYSIPGLALWRTDIIKANPIPLLTFNCDEYSQRDWCSKCNKVVFSDGEFLYRQNNPNAITKQFTDKQLEASLVDSMVLQRAVELNMAPTKLVEYANKKYEDLWFYTMWLSMNNNNIPRKRLRHLHKLFSESYSILHKYVTLTHWKYRWSSKNVFFFWTIIFFKSFRAKLLIKRQPCLF